MIFLQTLYSVILQEQLGVELGELSERAGSEILSVERKHRSIRTVI
jgi:hypothetical protein